MNLLHKLSVIIFLITFSVPSFASHIVGGEIYYDTIGTDANGDMQYNLYFELFRDCAGIDFPGEGTTSAPFNYTIFDENGNVIANADIPFNGSTELPLVYDDPCVEPPDDVCIESAIYQGTVTLPIIAGDYTIAYQVGNWAGSYVNFTNPAQVGMTITSTIPGTNTVSVANNSPRFADYPQIVFCLDNELTIPSNMIEEDGDSLAFKLCDPLLYDGTDLNPDPEAAPPYDPIPWEPGFSATQPFENGSPTNIDPITGDFSVTPSMLGNFVARICVEEWRDGVLINTHSRTFGYTIVECETEPSFEVSVLGGGDIIEGCGGFQFLIERNDTVGDVELFVETSGDAVMGYNYNNLDDTIIIPEGVTNDTIDVTTIYQDDVEGNLNGTVYILYENPCTGLLDTASTSFVILDYIEMELVIEDSINLCAETGDQYLLTPTTFTGGVAPYYFDWGNNIQPYPNNDTIIIDATILEDNYNPYNVSITDACGFEISSPTIDVYEQCRVVVPNIITPNGDNTNDYFVIRNNSDYDKISLQIYNRWGNLIYESDDYQDDWNGLDLEGNPVVEGVYFYTATPSGVKYTYRENDEENPYLMHGYVHVVRGKE